MDIQLAMLSIVGTLTIGAMSPGPSFVLVAQKSVSLSRQDGTACALGMGSGAAIFTVLALLGLQAIFLAIPLLFTVMKVLGGLYLIYLAYKIWQGASQPLKTELTLSAESSYKNSYVTGLLTQLSNPKTAIVFASTFAAFLPADFPLFQSLILIPIIFLIDFLWYAFVAFVLSSSKPRGAYLQAKKWIDRSAAGVLCALGLKLIADARLGIS